MKIAHTLSAVFWGVMACIGAAKAEKPPADLGAPVVDHDIVTQGDVITVAIPVKAEAPWTLRAWRVFAYRPYVPTACVDSGKWPLNESKHGRKWDSLQIIDWTWLPKDKPVTSLTVKLDTSDWCPGDYRLNVSGLFRKGKTDHYTSDSFMLSVLPRSD